MGKLRIGINGVGRIGRTLMNAWGKRANDNFEIVALNNPGDTSIHLHLLKYDSVHGVSPNEISLEGENLIFNGKKIKFFSEYDPAEIDWNSQNVDIVIDATGKFTDGASLGKHLGGSVKKVILCAPGKKVDGTFVMGINHENYNPSEHHIVSNASCTTNCLSPVAKVLNDTFGIESGFMTTIHSYTNDQNVLDNSHSDLRRARAAAVNMIPTSTGAAKALGLVIPELSGKLDGFAVRVPTPNVSMVDLTVNLKKAASVEAINKSILEASLTNLKGILAYSDEPLVSCDYNGRAESSIFDSLMTNVIGNTAKVVSWYDNETGFSNRVLDLTLYIGGKL